MTLIDFWFHFQVSKGFKILSFAPFTRMILLPMANSQKCRSSSLEGSLRDHNFKMATNLHAVAITVISQNNVLQIGSFSYKDPFNYFYCPVNRYVHLY